MDKVWVTVRVFFQEPFWIGVVERIADGKLEVSKITFGPEPKDYEVNEFLQKYYYKLQFSPAVDANVKPEGSMNPKRMQRMVRKQLESRGTGTKSQQALKALQEENKMKRKEKSRRKREEEKERQFELKQQKRKEKHRGR